MRRNTFLAALIGVGVSAGLASAQCQGYFLPPRAPDFQNTRPLYYNTYYGMTYGPCYNVYPSFAPFQGMLPGPASPAYPMPAGQNPFYKPDQNLMPAYMAMQKAAGIAAFPNHLYARSPRDYFMVDTDPRSSPFTYGLTGQGSTNVPPPPPINEP